MLPQIQPAHPKFRTFQNANFQSFKLANKKKGWFPFSKKTFEFLLCSFVIMFYTFVFEKCFPTSFWWFFISWFLLLSLLLYRICFCFSFCLYPYTHVYSTCFSFFVLPFSCYCTFLLYFRNYLHVLPILLIYFFFLFVFFAYLSSFTKGRQPPPTIRVQGLPTNPLPLPHLLQHHHPHFATLCVARHLPL